MFVASSLIHFNVPSASVLPVLRLVLLPSRDSAVAEDERASTLLLRVIEPHVDVAIEGARSSYLKFRSPAHPVDGILMRVPLVQ